MTPPLLKMSEIGLPNLPRIDAPEIYHTNSQSLFRDPASSIRELISLVSSELD